MTVLIRGWLSQRAIAAVIGTLLVGSALASSEKAASFYEDALKRFEKDDLPGALVQLKNSIQQDRKLLAAHLLLGRALMRSGELNGAEAAFEEALKQGVSRAEVAIPLGRVYMAQGRPDLVLDRIVAADLPPTVRAEVLALRGAAYAETGNARLSAQAFDDARVQDPKSPAPYIAEVPFLLAAGQRDRAKAAAAKAIELAPNNAGAWNMQASIKHALLDGRGALDDYGRAISLDARHVDARIARAALLIDLKRESESEKDLAVLAEIAPEEPRAAYLRALVAGRKGDAAAVAAALREVAGSVDALQSTWIGGREQILMLGALAHHAQGNGQKAREYLDMIVARNPRNLEARKLLASIHLQGRDYPRTLAQLEVLQKALPEDPQVLFLLGSAYLGQRRYQLATDNLEKAAARLGTVEVSRALAFSQLGLGRDELGLAGLERIFAAAPGDDQVGTTLAMLYLRRSQPQKAMQTAEAMVKRDPANLTAINFLGSLKGSAGDRAGARTAYLQVLAKDPAFRPAVLNLVRLDVSERRFDEARKRLNEILAKRGEDQDALYELGLLEEKAGRADEAIRSYKKASDIQRRDPRPGIALVELQLAQRKPEDALASAKEIVSRFPDNLGVQLLLGRTSIAVGDMRAARTIFSNATRSAEYNADLQVSIGRLQLAAGNPDGATYNVQKALQGVPDDPAGLALAVDVELRRGDTAKADTALKLLVSKHPNRVESALATADVAMARAQYPAAVTAFRTALSRQESSAILLHLVRAQIAAGETPKAVTSLETWLKKHPGDRSALKALAESQFRVGQLAASRATFEKVVAAEPNDAMSLNNYANVLIKLNELPAAQAQAEKALKLVPDSPEFADSLGWILVRQGKVDAGLRYLREARLRNPGNPEIRFHLAFALEKAGRKAEAREELGVVLKVPASVRLGPEVVKLKAELGL